MTAVAVVGGTGKTGRAVVGALSGHGVRGRALGRAAWDDLPASLAGCDAVYVIAPNLHHDEPGYVAHVLDSARAAGVGRVVYHSVAAPYSPLMPHHVDKAVAEDAVRRSGLEWTLLQPCAYVQNLLPGLREEPPTLEVAYDLDAPFGLVDLADVAEAAALVLSGEGHRGATYELGGPALVSVRDVAAAAAGVLGREVTARRVAPSAWSAAGLDRRVEEGLRAMFVSYDRHGFPAGSLALRALLGRRPASVTDCLHRELGRPG